MKLRKWGLPAAFAAACLMTSGSALAQDDDGGPMKQGDDAVYIEVVNVKFKPGKRERAMQIIAEHFAPAGAAAGTPAPMLAVHYQTGEWDAAFVWVLEGGMADLEWYRSPDSVKWMEALAEQEGGMEAAQALLAEYGDAVAEAEADVGHYHTGEESE